MCYKKWGGVVGNFFGHMRRTTLNRYCMGRSGGNFVGNEEVVYSVTLCTAMKQENDKVNHHPSRSLCLEKGKEIPYFNSNKKKRQRGPDMESGRSTPLVRLTDWLKERVNSVEILEE